MKFGIVTIARVAIAVFLTVGVCATAQQFTEAPRYDSTSNVQGVVAGDFNRDGKPDVAFAACCYTLTIKLGNGDGTFTTSQQIDASEATAIASGDWNEDGIADLALTTSFPSSVYILLGKGDGTFTLANTYSLTDQPFGIAAGDVNGDGVADLAIAYEPQFTTGGVDVLLGVGGGAFQPAVPYLVPGYAFSVAVADLNGDGRADVVASEYTVAGNFEVFLANADGTLQAPMAYAGPINQRSVLVADFNHDGIPDLAGAGDFTNVAVLIGKGDGTFQNAVFYESGGALGALSVADVNADGSPDLLAANDASVGVLLGKPDGTFQKASLFGVGPDASALAAADFNLDGHLDVVSTDFNDPRFSVLIGDGSGNFVARREYQTALPGQYPSITSMVAARLNTSGKELALVLADHEEDQLIVFHGNKAGIFQGPQDFATDRNPHSVALGDFNRDGNVDAVTANDGANSISVLLGTGKGGFRTHVDYSTAREPEVVLTSDVNRDGKTDVITGNINSISVLLNSGSGFSSHVDTPLAADLLAMGLGDFNRDGNVDVVVVDQTSTVNVLLGNGDGTFTAGQAFYGGKQAEAIAVGDVNSDGKLDLAVGHTQGSSVTIWQGNGDGTFTKGAGLSAGNNPTQLFIADFTGDGKMDVISLAGSSQGGFIDFASVYLFPGNGKGTFQPGQLYDSSGSTAAVVGDFNNDGLLDIATSGLDDYNTPVAAVLLNTGVK